MGRWPVFDRKINGPCHFVDRGLSNWWHRGRVVKLHSQLATGYVALGGGGLARLLIHLFIWHEIWRLLHYVWHIHTFGPVIVIVVVLVLIALSVWHRQWRPFRRRQRGGSTGYGTGGGPRDW
jgi:hypothetical protein